MMMLIKTDMEINYCHQDKTDGVKTNAYDIGDDPRRL
jgi:hypothetical protein